MAGSLLTVCVGTVQAQGVPDPTPVPSLCGAPADLTGAAFKDKENVDEDLYYFIQDAGDFVYNIDKSADFVDGFTADVDDDYVILSTLENDQVSNKYLHVDTSYFASAGATYKMYNKIGVTAKAASMVPGYDQCFNQIAKGLPLDAFRFKFTKNLANDSIWVQAMVEAVEMDREATTPTVYNNKDKNAYTSWSYANTVDTEAAKMWPAIDANTAADVQNGTGENLILSHCKLVDEQEKVITFYSCDGTRTENV